MKNLIIRLKNTGTILSLVSLVVLILSVNGFNIDNERIITTVKALCSIGVLLGVLNNPTTNGIDNPIKEVK